MSVQSRLGKLEEATGINEPCEVCETVGRFTKSAVELLNRIGIVDRTPSAITSITCAWCLRPITVDVAEYTLSERVLFERLDAAYTNGTFCLPENKTLWDEVTAALDRSARKKYGQHYERYRELEDKCHSEINEIATRRAPLKMYLCRVAGCACEYPKTEAEWRANAKAKGLHLAA